MTETTAVRPNEPSVLRLSIALIVAVTMWVAAAFAVATSLVAPSTSLDARPGTGIRVMTALAPIAAIALFFGSGPVAHWIGRRSWLLALPAIGLAGLGVGVVIARAT